MKQCELDPRSVPLDKIDVSDPELFETDTHWGYFERLRAEDPVHYCATNEEVGPYWSVTKHADIVSVEKDPEVYSSARSIVLQDPDPEFPLEAGFITMDGPRHDAHRKVVQPVAAPRNLVHLEPLIRQRVIEILEGLPVGETFDWVDRVSIELTTGMLATLFDFPWEERRKLTRWSDIVTADPEVDSSIVASEEQRRAELLECLETFTALWKQREGKVGERLDFVTALANSEETRGISPLEYLGTLILLIVGGNDTTRNSISGGVLALNQFPDQYRKLRDDPSLIPNMVSEIIRWQTPLAYMRRTAMRDTELAGKKIRTGDKVAMWYVSGNRDEAVFEAPNELRIDRKNARQHLSFGLGVHFCMGSRLAEMQLRVLWEEALRRFHSVDVVGPPVRVRNSFVKGYAKLPVRVQPWS
jgi:cytochrome P450